MITAITSHTLRKKRLINNCHCSFFIEIPILSFLSFSEERAYKMIDPVLQQKMV